MRSLSGYTFFVMDAAIIESEALKLSEAERAVLADRLLASLSPVSGNLKAAWIRESDSRMEAFRKGTLEAVDGPATLRTLRERFSK